ncbi:hypothetical protein O9K51_10265 [Purpureocillium lavendulum]|uniref:Uncharacterized protein n=1 Tax=Purpureocillium lavendulum TaxID=1247861 RepID=A0AB34FFV8_9HYPO|nr:hypothetical protein O9K51_10265 [Purpureocillium lavendulum]
MLLPATLSGAVLGAAALIFAAPIRAAKQCYWMDGTLTDSVVQPCNPDADVSPCCALNKPKPDLCLSSGLCYSQDSGVEGFIYSDGCTDKTGEDEKCPHFCTDRTQKWKAYNILQCEAGNPGSQFCCRTSSDNSNCCGNKTALMGTSIGTIQLPSSSSKTTSSVGGSMSTPTSTGASSATCVATKPDTATGSDGVAKNECPKDNTAVVGGAVGGVLGAALLVALGAIAALCMRRPQAQKQQEAITPYEHYSPAQQPAAAAVNKESPPRYFNSSSRPGRSNFTLHSVHAEELPAPEVHEAPGDQVKAFPVRHTRAPGYH